MCGVPAAAALAACGKRKPSTAALKSDARVLAIGDSLTFGYGASPDASWPVKLGEITGWQVENAGVNGDTSAGALQRLPSLLAAGSYDGILIGIGGNDMLRGVSASATRDNIAALVKEAREHTPHVALLATPAPDAMRAFVGSLSDAPFYEEVAKSGQALLVANVYSSVLSDASLRSDRIHANAQGYAKVAQLLADQFKAAGWR
ncbi:lipolytic protein G-D-S-L family [Variovorax paradoxus EPS]|uniref:Lipolytic protein G-D-S-L family n=2 Tax=Variovorax paradoxus TaxID=34073 RepID=E6UXU0_VARPE|nr:lipolytic protein G-D-S-L family [Variovorax paradoxus EPS]